MSSSLNIMPVVNADGGSLSSASPLPLPLPPAPPPPAPPPSTTPTSWSTWYSWLVLFFSAINVICLGGKRRAFGMFVSELKVEFNSTSLAELNWIGDSYAAFGYASSAGSTAVIMKFGHKYALFQSVGSGFILLACTLSALVSNPHWLFLTYSLLHGIGSSLVLSCAGLVVNEHFPRGHNYRLLATTFLSGGSLGSIVFILIYAYLIEMYGWRWTFGILGGLFFVVNNSASVTFACKNGSTLPPPLSPDVVESECSLSSSSSSLSRSPPPNPPPLRLTFTRKQIPLLVLWTMDRMLTSIVTYGLLFNLGHFQRRMVKELISASSLTTMFAAGEATTFVVAALLAGVTKTLLHNRLKYVLLISTALFCVQLAVWEKWQASLSVGNVLAFGSGLCVGPSVTFLFPAGEEMTGLPGHLAYSFSLAGMGLGMALSPLFTAAIAEFNDFKNFFLIQSVLFAVKLICLLLAIGWMQWQQLPHSEEMEVLLEKRNAERSCETGSEEERPTETTALLPKQKCYT